MLSSPQPWHCTEILRGPGDVRGTEARTWLSRRLSTTVPLAQPFKGKQCRGDRSSPGKGLEETEGPFAPALPACCPPWGSSGDFAQHLPANSCWPRTMLAGLADGAATGRCSHGGVSSVSVLPKAPSPRGGAARGSLCLEMKMLSRLSMAKKSWKLCAQQPRNCKGPRGIVSHPEVSRCLSRAGDFSEPAAQGERR